MADLRTTMSTIRFGQSKTMLTHISTLLNSGNVIFKTTEISIDQLEKTISEQLEKSFGFPIPVRVRNTEMLMTLLANDPFQNSINTQQTRCYISFLKNETNSEVTIPWTSKDHSFSILSAQEKTIVSVLDLAITNTPKAMGALEKIYGKDITTRNWNTLKRIETKLSKEY
jgi:uncharacterized protein (DUF1697 family)